LRSYHLAAECNSMIQQVKLIADCPATIIPAGDSSILPSGTQYEVVQSLGGSLTVRHKGILYRIDAADLKCIAEDDYKELSLSQESSSDTAANKEFSEQDLWDALSTCYDPEIPINIVDLGLIYDLKYSQRSDNELYDVRVQMTLTAQGCGMGPVIADDAKRKLETHPSVNSAQVDIVWDPPWTPHMISEAGREKLGIE